MIEIMKTETTPVEKFKSKETREQIISALQTEWDNLFNKISTLNGEVSNDNTVTKIKEAEFENIIKMYEKQERTEKSLRNILNFLKTTEDPMARLAVLYKDVYYEKTGGYENNRHKSLSKAMELVNILNWPEDKKIEFQKIFK